MRRRAWLLPAFVFLASPLFAQPAAPPPALDAATGILAYIPADADLAVLVRMDALAKTDLWLRFRQPQDGIYHEIVKEFDLAIDFEWADGSPDPRINADYFSARWTRTLYFDEGDYEFQIFHDDGAG